MFTFKSDASARRAAKWGGIACSVQAIREGFGGIVAAFSGGVFAPSYLFGAVIALAMFAALAVRLWRYRGWISGTVAASFIAIEMAVQLFTPSLVTDKYDAATAMFDLAPGWTSHVAFWASFLVKLIILAFVVRGVCGAYAMKKGHLPDAMERG